MGGDHLKKKPCVGKPMASTGHVFSIALTSPLYRVGDGGGFLEFLVGVDVVGQRDGQAVLVEADIVESSSSTGAMEEQPEYKSGLIGSLAGRKRL